jgi:hypothetical protein
MSGLVKLRRRAAQALGVQTDRRLTCESFKVLGKARNKRLEWIRHERASLVICVGEQLKPALGRWRHVVAEKRL